MQTGTASRPLLLRRGPLLAMVALGALLALSPSCTRSRQATAYCVYENNVMAGGLCLTECESRCNLEALAGCGSSTCVPSCDARAAELPHSCQEASYAYWRCQRLAGEPHVECHGHAPELATPASVCATERRSKESACSGRDAGMPLDA